MGLHVVLGSLLFNVCILAAENAGLNLVTGSLSQTATTMSTSAQLSDAISAPSSSQASSRDLSDSATPLQPDSGHGQLMSSDPSLVTIDPDSTISITAASTTPPPTNGDCHAECVLNYADPAIIGGRWIAHDIVTTITAFTKVLIVNNATNETRTSLMTNTKLLGSHTIPTETDADGMRTTTMTQMFEHLGIKTTITLTYPTTTILYSDYFLWNGTLQTSGSCESQVGNGWYTQFFKSAPTLLPDPRPPITDLNNDSKGWYHSYELETSAWSFHNFSSEFPDEAALKSCVPAHGAPEIAPVQQIPAAFFATVTSTSHEIGGPSAAAPSNIPQHPPIQTPEVSTPPSGPTTVAGSFGQQLGAVNSDASPPRRESDDNNFGAANPQPRPDTPSTQVPGEPSQVRPDSQPATSSRKPPDGVQPAEPAAQNPPAQTSPAQIPSAQIPPAQRPPAQTSISQIPPAQNSEAQILPASIPPIRIHPPITSSTVQHTPEKVTPDATNLQDQAQNVPANSFPSLGSVNTPSPNLIIMPVPQNTPAPPAVSITTGNSVLNIQALASPREESAASQDQTNKITSSSVSSDGQAASNAGNRGGLSSNVGVGQEGSSNSRGRPASSPGVVSNSQRSSSSGEDGDAATSAPPALVLGSHTLTAGGQPATLEGTVISLPVGASNIVIGTSTQALPAAISAASTYRPGSHSSAKNADTNTAKDGMKTPSAIVYGSQTLTQGIAATIGGTLVSLAPGASNIAIGGITQALPSFATDGSAELVVDGTPKAAGSVSDGTTLRFHAVGAAGAASSSSVHATISPGPPATSRAGSVYSGTSIANSPKVSYIPNDPQQLGAGPDSSPTVISGTTSALWSGTSIFENGTPNASSTGTDGSVAFVSSTIANAGGKEDPNSGASDVRTSAASGRVEAQLYACIAAVTTMTAGIRFYMTA